jgi:hypothetical protein
MGGERERRLQQGGGDKVDGRIDQWLVKEYGNPK